MNSHIAKQIYQVIQDAKNILLVPHQNPDGDALGSSTAFAKWLRQENKTYSFFCATPFQPKFSYLFAGEKVHTCADVWIKEPIDVLVVFDSGDLRYAGIASYVEKMDKKPIIINIDHHATNESYGDYNLVVSSSSSTCEMIYRFFLENKIQITADMATSLLTGLITDTDNFTNSATSPFSLSMASALVAAGGHFYHIKETVYHGTTLGALSVWGIALSRLYHQKDLNLVYTYLTLEDIKNAQATETEIEGIANFLNSLNEGDYSLTLKEKTPNVFKGSFRTTRNDLDVSAYAKALGGGGHKKAAGFVVEGTITEALEKIFAAIRSCLIPPNPLY